MAPINTANIKQYNRNKIFRLIASRNKISKQEIAYELHMSLPTISQNLQDLKNAGLIMENGALASSVGRKATGFSIVPDAKVALGLDITLNHISMVLVNLNGSVIHSMPRKHYQIQGTEESYREVSLEISEFLKASGVSPDRVLGIGISIPGIITEYGTYIFQSSLPVPGNFYECIRPYIPFPYTLYNDANCGGLAEFWSRSDIDAIAYLSLSNTVGGSILMGGETYLGASNRSAEFGHVTLDPNGLPCYCGKIGCSDAYLNAKLLSSMAGDNLAAFFEGLKSGNESFRQCFDIYLRNLSILINNISMSLDCDLILGGYVGIYLEPYIERLKELVSARSTFPTDGSYIKASSKGFEAAAVGSALYYIDEFIQQI